MSVERRREREWERENPSHETGERCRPEESIDLFDHYVFELHGISEIVSHHEIILAKKRRNWLHRPVSISDK